MTTAGYWMSSRRTRINRHSVVNAALLVVDNVGLDGLTIRGVARVVGVPAMSLYSHFAKKEDLLDLMYGEISRRLYPGPEHTSWEGALGAFCHKIREVVLAHPGWVPLMSRPAPVLSLPGRERLLKLMTTAGIPAERAMATLSSAGLLALGLSIAELSFRDRDGVSGFTKRFENLQAQVTNPDFAGENPITSSALSHSRGLDLGTNFSSTVETFITGLALQLTSSQPAQAPLMTLG
jgi:AcrR family transcriptional regulator